MNTAGYGLLDAHRVDDALLVFRANAEAFPRKANVWDSLGEALALARLSPPAGK